MTPARRAALLLVLAATAALPAQATSLQFCDRPQPLDAARQDLLLRFGALVRSELERSGGSVALVARSGLDLDRFDIRTSHAGVALRAVDSDARWSVRQLYYACDEGRPRLYDQGLAGFVLGSAGAAPSRVSLVVLPAAPAAALEAAARDDARATTLLGAAYSANAYPFATRYQNCNQWLAELLALAWDDTAEDATGPGSARAGAQRWLLVHGYEPDAVDAGTLLSLAGLFVPWVHRVDHPEADLARGTFRISLPASIESFVARSVPGAARVELCQAGRRVVVRRGWTALGADCAPAAGDEVVELGG